MTPLDMMIHGIENDDMDEVAKGFNALTNKNVVPGTTIVATGVPVEVKNALAFYADKESYSFGSGAVPVMLDEGKQAVDALSLLNGGAAPAKAKKGAVKAKAPSPTKKAAPKKRVGKQPVEQSALVAATNAAPAHRRPDWVPTENLFDTQMRAGKGIDDGNIKKEKLIYAKVSTDRSHRPTSTANEMVRTTCPNGHTFECRKFELEIAGVGTDAPRVTQCPKCRKGAIGG